MDTKQIIATKAQELFSELGYDKTSMKMLASKAQVNEVTIYRHFGTKDNLLQYITSQYIEEIHILDKVDKIKTSSIENVMTNIIDWFINYCFDNEQIYKIQMKMEDYNENFIKLKLTKNFVSATQHYLQYLASNNKFDGDCYLFANTIVTSILGIFTAYAIDSKYFKKQDVIKCVNMLKKMVILQLNSK